MFSAFKSPFLINLMMDVRCFLFGGNLTGAKKGVDRVKQVEAAEKNAVSLKASEQRTYSVAQLREVVLEGRYGSVKIRGEEVDELSVSLVRTGFGMDEVGARAELEASRVEFLLEADRLTLRSSSSLQSSQLGSGGGMVLLYEPTEVRVCGCQFDLDLTVPHHWVADWQANLNEGDITFENLQVQRARLGNDSESIRAIDVAGPVEVSSDSGEISIIGGRGDTTIENFSGDSLIRGRTGGGLSVMSYLGECALDFLNGLPLETSVEAHSVRLALSPDADARLELKAEDGQIKGGFKLYQASSGEVPTSAKTMNVTLNKGGHSIAVNATSGNITLEDTTLSLR